MTPKPVLPRERALWDIEEAIDHYRSEAGQATALAFVEALEVTLRALAEHPAAGSPRYDHELNLPGLRSLVLQRFPYLVFYMERDDHIDLWRVLHAHRDIPAWLLA